jgi:hypothetical protein
MSHLSQNLERLIQMMSIEQLIGLLKQTNNTNNINSTTNNDVLLSPIVQKVVQEYEQEIKELKSNVSQGTNNIVPIIKDYSDDIAKIHKQLIQINTNLLSLADTIKNITQVNSINHVNSENLTPAPITIISGENIRLNIEEKINVDDKEEEELEVDEEELEEEELEEEELEEEELEEEVKVDDKNICECKVILDEDIVVVDDKNHCGGCDLIVLQEEELEEEVEEEEVEEEEVEEEEVEVSDKENEEVEVSDKEEEEEVSEKEISDEEVEVSDEEEVTNKEEVEVSDKEQEEEQQVTNEDEEVFEIEIDDITYYATHEENGILYAVEKDGDVGAQVGIIKDGEPIFS